REMIADAEDEAAMWAGGQRHAGRTSGLPRDLGGGRSMNDQSEEPRPIRTAAELQVEARRLIAEMLKQGEAGELNRTASPFACAQLPSNQVKPMAGRRVRRKRRRRVAGMRSLEPAVRVGSRNLRSEYSPDDFVAMRLEASAMTEQNTLRMPGVDFCERRF